MKEIESVADCVAVIELLCVRGGVPVCELVEVGVIVEVMDDVMEIDTVTEAVAVIEMLDVRVGVRV